MGPVAHLEPGGEKPARRAGSAAPPTAFGEHLDGSPAPGERLDQARRCNAAPNHRDRSGSGRRGWKRGDLGGCRRAVEDRFEAFALAGETRFLFNGEARPGEAAAHHARHGERRRRRARFRQPRQLREQRGGPHVGVFRRRETIEEPGVGRKIHLRQRRLRFLVKDGQRDPSMLENAPVRALVRGGPGRDQGLGQGRNLWKGVERAGRIRTRQRKPFHADEVQACVRRGAAPEAVPKGEEIQAGTKAQLPDHGDVAIKPVRKPRPGEKHRARLLQTVLGGEVDVVRTGRDRISAAPGQRRVRTFQFVGIAGHGRRYISSPPARQRFSRPRSARRWAHPRAGDAPAGSPCSPPR